MNSRRTDFDIPGGALDDKRVVLDPKRGRRDGEGQSARIKAGGEPVEQVQSQRGWQLRDAGDRDFAGGDLDLPVDKVEGADDLHLGPPAGDVGGASELDGAGATRVLRGAAGALRGGGLVVAGHWFDAQVLDVDQLAQLGDLNPGAAGDLVYPDRIG